MANREKTPRNRKADRTFVDRLKLSMVGALLEKGGLLAIWVCGLIAVLAAISITQVINNHNFAASQEQAKQIGLCALEQTTELREDNREAHNALLKERGLPEQKIELLVPDDVRPKLVQICREFLRRTVLKVEKPKGSAAAAATLPPPLDSAPITLPDLITTRPPRTTTTTTDPACPS